MQDFTLFRTLSKYFLGIAMLLAAFVLSGCGGGGTTTYTIGGTVSGLSGSVVLQNNGGDNLTVSQNGNFTFSTGLADGTAYSVTVLTQPTDLTCSVSNGSGSVSAGNVSNVSVSCKADPNGVYTSGTITELSVSDLIGLVHNNRLMMMSPATGLVYDGTISVLGSTYTGSAKAYIDGENPQTVTIEGSVTTESKITGVISGGNASVNGTFEVLYSTTYNNVTSSMTDIAKEWRGTVGGTSLYRFIVDNNASVSYVSRGTGAVFLCDGVAGSISPISNTALYSLSLDFSSCASTDMQSNFTGLAFIDEVGALNMIFTSNIYGFLGNPEFL